MHEQSLINDLIRQITAIARAQKAEKIIGVTLRLGALAHISQEHLCEHFAHAARGTLAEGAALTIQLLEDTTDPRAQDILLDSIEVEE